MGKPLLRSTSWWTNFQTTLDTQIAVELARGGFWKNALKNRAYHLARIISPEGKVTLQGSYPYHQQYLYGRNSSKLSGTRVHHIQTRPHPHIPLLWQHFNSGEDNQAKIGFLTSVRTPPLIPRHAHPHSTSITSHTHQYIRGIQWHGRRCLLWIFKKGNSSLQKKPHCIFSKPLPPPTWEILDQVNPSYQVDATIYAVSAWKAIYDRVTPQVTKDQEKYYKAWQWYAATWNIDPILQDHEQINIITSVTDFSARVRQGYYDKGFQIKVPNISKAL